MQIHYTLIAIATIVQFILGAVWYSPLMFGTWWMQIMEVTHIPKDELKKMQQEMGPFYGLQILLTLMSTFTLAMFLEGLPSAWSTTGAAGFVWLGFIVPVQVSSVILGKTKKKFWGKQLFVMATNQFVSIMLAAFILSM